MNIFVYVKACCAAMHNVMLNKQLLQFSLTKQGFLNKIDTDIFNYLFMILRLTY